jgi:hypothetical protein
MLNSRPKALNAVRIDPNSALVGLNVTREHLLMADCEVIKVVFLQAGISSPFIWENRTPWNKQKLQKVKYQKTNLELSVLWWWGEE